MAVFLPGDVQPAAIATAKTAIQSLEVTDLPNIGFVIVERMEVSSIEVY
jgi:hypothetical protein